MAEIGILARSVHTSGDMNWQRGDVVAIHPDGHTWGSKEGLPNAWIIKIPGATVAECQAYLDAVTDASGEVTKLRGKRLDYNTLSTPLKRQLDDTGTLTVTKAQADAYIKSIA